MSDFDQIVFSGGGTRCFWQGGFLDVLCHEMDLRPDRITGVSGGALSAVGFVAGCERALLETMRDAFEAQDSNIAWHTREIDGLTPHQRVYNEVVCSVIDSRAENAVADGPQMQILIAHPMGGGKIGGTLAAMLYQAELYTKARADGRWPEMAGVEGKLIDARRAARDGKLRELVCAAATIPPIFELPLWDGKPVIDGGMASQVPFPEPDEGKTLIMLTRHYGELPQAENRTFVEPSREVPADKIDFTDPAKIVRTWDLGHADARRFLQSR